MTAGRVRFVLDPELTPTLREQIAAIWVAVTRAGGAVGAGPGATPADLEPVIGDALSGVAERNDHMVAAHKDGELVGFGFLSFRPGPLFRHWAMVKRLQVHPAHQNRGFGGALLDELSRVAREELRLEQLHLTVRGGTGTERFYEERGYVVVATIPEVIRVAPDDTRDEIYMVARL